MNPGVTEEAGRVASIAVDAMRSVPLALALLVVNVAFLVFAAYILGEVAESSVERNKSQIDLIGKLVSAVEDCQKAPTP